jgi:hypothetical protein
VIVRDERDFSETKFSDCFKMCADLLIARRFKIRVFLSDDLAGQKDARFL